MTHHLRVYAYSPADPTLELGRIRINVEFKASQIDLENLIEMDVPAIRTARGHLKHIFPGCIVVAKVTKK